MFGDETLGIRLTIRNVNCTNMIGVYRIVKSIRLTIRNVNNSGVVDLGNGKYVLD